MRRTIPYIAVSLIVIAAPVIIVSLWLAYFHDATLLDHAPFWNDELYHWHQAATFAEVGFGNGYYTLNENIPLADFSHYYAWGAWIYVYYGLIGKITGLGLSAIQFINIGTFLLASAVFIWGTRPKFEGLLWFGSVLATFIPLLNYLPSSLLQLPNLAIALLLAGAFYHLLRRKVSTGFLIALTVFCMIAGLLRPTWTMFLFPAYVLASQKRNLWTIIRALLVSVPLTLVAAAGFYLSAAPFPHFRTRIILGEGSLFDKFLSYLDYIRQSFIWMTEGHPTIIGQRLQILLLIVLVLVWGIWQWRRSRGEPKLVSNSEWFWETALHLFNLIAFYGTTILLHETLGGHDYRVMAPHLFFSMVLLALFQRRFLLIPMILSMVLLLPAEFDIFQQKAPNFNGIVQEQYEHWNSEFAEVLIFDPEAESPWCNTVITSIFYVTPAQGESGLVLAIEPGFGVSWYHNWDDTGEYSIPEEFNARYLIMTDVEYDEWGRSLNLQEMMPVQGGTLYENLDSACNS